jgi:protein-tyrosine phosphatase
MSERIGVCFVCAGNICRSPTAEGTFRHLCQERGVLDRFDIDSAATGRWHLGEPPNSRAQEAAKARGITLEGKARQFTRDDFARFDHVLVMDHENRRDILRLAEGADKAKVQLLLAYDSESPPDAEVPDPYYGSFADYELVMELCMRACTGLLAALLNPDRSQS